MENISENQTINLPLLPGGITAILPLVDLNPRAIDANAYAINRFIKNLRLFVSIESLEPMAYPANISEFTDAEAAAILRELEWNSPRYQLEMYTLDSLWGEWIMRGAVSLLCRDDIPFYDISLMSYFAEGLAIELGRWDNLGFRFTDAGYGFPKPNVDIINLYASLIRENQMPSSNPGTVTNTISTVSPFSNATGTSVALTANTSATALAANASRVYALFTNNGSSDIWINYGATATIGSGTVIKGGGGTHEIGSTNPYTGVVSAISANATSLAVISSNG